MPDWLVTVFVQYPIAGINALVIWYAWQQVRERENSLNDRADSLRKEIRGAAEGEITRFQTALANAQEAHLNSKNQEIERLSKDLASKLESLSENVVGELKSLSKNVAQLTKKQV
jgi:biopolymer transport protein ExbB/TolQ